MHYVCSKHFEGEFGPTMSCPDPITAYPYMKDRETERKAPKERESLPLKKRKIQIKAENDTAHTSMGEPDVSLQNEVN